MSIKGAGFAVICLIFIGCGEDHSQTNLAEDIVVRDSIVCYSLLGEPLTYPTETRFSFAHKDSLLTIARQDYERDPTDLNNIIWYGRRLAYLTEYPAAMRIFTRGLHLHPRSPELYRHRGHRFISMRRFDEAVNDLQMAAALAQGREIETEPDGIPNRLNTPLSSLQFNIWYHLGLAEYLRGNYINASRAYDSCMIYSINDDLLCATSDWYYLTTLRTGDTTKGKQILARITPGMEIIENAAYHRRLLMYKGELSPDEVLPPDSGAAGDGQAFVTLGYGVARFLEQQGDRDRARTIYERVLATDAWSGFGYIATEADKAMSRW